MPVTKARRNERAEQRRQAATLRMGALLVLALLGAVLWGLPLMAERIRSWFKVPWMADAAPLGRSQRAGQRATADAEDDSGALSDATVDATGVTAVTRLPPAAEILEKGARLYKVGPVDAVDFYAPFVALAATHRAWAPLDHARVLDAYADALVAAKEASAAADARAEGVRLRAAPGSGASVTDLLLGHVGVADTATKALRFAEAFAAIEAARAVLRGRESAASRAGLLRAEAAVADCAGDSARAVRLSDAAAAIAPLPAGPIHEPAHVTIATDRIRYLRRAAAAAAAASPGAGDAEGRFLDESSRLAAALVAGGAFSDPDQLPRTFTRGLPPGRPWHSFARGGGGYPELRPLRRLLEDAAEALRVEFLALADGGHLLVEQECIHDPAPPPGLTGGGADAGLSTRLGSWTYFTVNGPWLRGRDERGCASAIAPVACALLANASALRGAGGAPMARILRGGYSALAGRGHIRPHCGLTNTQLKMHVGLITPSFVDSTGGEESLPCAALTVGNETRAWEAGKVLFFDDSFTHAVSNKCDERRAVFQLVIGHPAIPPAASASPGGLMGD